MESLVFVNKWLHLLSMIGTLGGMAFAWLVLRPATTTVGYADQQRLSPLWRAFGISLGVFWVLVITTGIINYLLVHQSVNAQYKMLLAVKVVMVSVMFALSAVSARPIRGQRSIAPGKVLGLLLILGIAVVGISARLNLSRIDGTGLRHEVASVWAAR